MNNNQVSVGTALSIIGFTVLYLILFIYVEYRLVTWPKRKRKKLLQEAVKDGRRITAHLEKYEPVYSNNKEKKYRGQYSYTAPDGRQYSLRREDCIYNSEPPEEITVYLYPDSYKDYYTGKENVGIKHGGVFTLFYFAAGYIGYISLAKLLFL